MKRQLKHRRNKDSKLNKEFKRLEADIDNLKSQMDSLKDKITKASKSTPEFRLIDGAFNGAYRRYRIDGRPRMDVETFFDRIG